jgi:hypothetical protein
VSTPVLDTAGWTANSALLLLVTTNETVWVPSPGPAETAVAQGVTVCAPASSLTVGSAPLVNDGSSLTPVIVKLTVAVAVFGSAAPLVVPLSSTV